MDSLILQMDFLQICQTTGNHISIMLLQIFIILISLLSIELSSWDCTDPISYAIIPGNSPVNVQGIESETHWLLFTIRPRWSRGNVIASISRFACSNPTEVDGFFQDLKIPRTSRPGGILRRGSRVWDFRLVKEPQACKKVSVQNLIGVFTS